MVAKRGWSVLTACEKESVLWTSEMRYRMREMSSVTATGSAARHSANASLMDPKRTRPPAHANSCWTNETVIGLGKVSNIFFVNTLVNVLAK
jgi:hypothetical protein